MREIRITLPTLHKGQVDAWRLPGRFKAICCGRRWGKTDLGKTVGCDTAIKGFPVGWFTPDYKIQSEAYSEILDILEPIKRTASQTAGLIRTITKGRIDFWTLENERAGRSRKYKKIIIDEAAFTKPNMMDVWTKSIMPTLLDMRGSALVLSNTNGVDKTNFFWRICNEPEHGFVKYHAPTHQNPYMPAEELARLEKTMHPLVYKQEYMAEFVDWSGVQFFALSDMMNDGQPFAMPRRLDAVFATIDSATKTGTLNDGTGVVYWGFTRFPEPALYIIDYDIKQIEGALLETWLPGVFQYLETLAREFSARGGSAGAHIEDKASGMILLQQAARHGWPAHPIDSKLTSVGKDERAISVSGYVYQKLVRMTSRAFDRVTTYKMQTQNHLMGQVLGFRIGNKDSLAQDDLLDCFTYGISLALGNSGGF